MSVQKDGKGWKVQYAYYDLSGKRKQSTKRGFKTQKEAKAWELENAKKQNSNLSMTFEKFYELYTAYKKSRVKESTWDTKEHVVRTKILPYFGKRKLNSITPQDVITWQNMLMEHRDKNGKGYSPDYLKSVHAQLSAIFNYAVNFFNLQSNPAKKAGCIGDEVPKEMLIWTKEEYQAFAEAIMDKPRSYYAFELLYWTGMREGELLALTPADFDFEKGTVAVTKTYYRKRGEDKVTSPKTRESNRVIIMPPFLVDEIQDYLKQLYDIKPHQRMFEFTKSFLEHEMERGCKVSGVKVIRIHDLRHSHASLLIHMGFSVLAIGKRLGHSSEKITNRYAHLFPTVQTEMAEKLEFERSGENVG